MAFFSTIQAKLGLDVTNFERGMAKAQSRTLAFRRNLSQFGAGGLSRFLGVGALVSGYVAAINKAQQLRDEAEKNGTAISRNTESLAKYGDQLDKLKAGIAQIGVESVGFLARMGEGLGSLINRARFGKEAAEQMEQAAAATAARQRELDRLQAESEQRKKDRAKEQEKLAESQAKIAYEQLSLEDKITHQKKVAEEATAKAATLADSMPAKYELQRKALEAAAEAAKLQERLDKENLKTAEDIAKAREDYNDEVKEGQQIGETEAQQMDRLLRESRKLNAEAEQARADEARFFNLQKQAQEKANEAERIRIKLVKDRADAEAAVAKAASGFATSNRDRVAGSLGELAAGARGTRDEQARARRVLQLEARARRSFDQGNEGTSAALLSRADELRKGLGGRVQSSDVEVLKSQLDELKAATAELKEIKASLEPKAVE
jgi:hypothetical protein